MNRRIIMSANSLILTSLTLLALFCGAASVNAQESQTPQRGFNPAGSYAISDVETINTTNGNLMLRIPIAALPPGRGGSPGPKVDLLYNSKLWDTRTEEALNMNNEPFTRSRLIGSPQGGWLRTVPYGLQFQLQLSSNDSVGSICPDPFAVYLYKLSMIFPDGSSHEFRPQAYTEFGNTGLYNITPGGVITTCQQTVPVDTIVTNTLTYYSTDGSYLRLDIEHDSDPYNWQNNPWTLYMGLRVKTTATSQARQSAQGQAR
ncbi:MAG: hypothetical protein WBV94_05780 [Blastocatellia bacterium]